MGGKPGTELVGRAERFCEVCELHSPHKLMLIPETRKVHDAEIGVYNATTKVPVWECTTCCHSYYDEGAVNLWKEIKFEIQTCTEGMPMDMRYREALIEIKGLLRWQNVDSAEAQQFALEEISKIIEGALNPPAPGGLIKRGV